MALTYAGVIHSNLVGEAASISHHAIGPYLNPFQVQGLQTGTQGHLEKLSYMEAHAKSVIMATGHARPVQVPSPLREKFTARTSSALLATPGITWS